METAFDTLFVVNQVINLVFIVDIFVQFLMPIPDPVTGELIRNHRTLAKKYLTGWFPIDVVSVLPVDILVVAVPNIIPPDNTTLVRTIRLLRVMRLFKVRSSARLHEL